MDIIVCSCLKCGTVLGSFRNSWIGIGNTYFSPVYPPTTYLNGFDATGDVFTRGPDGSAVQNSVLQDLACRKCAAVVGLRCDDAPEGHLLKKNQFILRLADMHVISEQTGDKAVVSVLQKVPLVAPGAKKPPAVRRNATTQPTPCHQTPNSVVGDGIRKPTNGTMLPPAEDMLGRDTSKFTNWDGDTIKGQQRDIDRISGAVSRIEKDMKSFKDFMVEVRAELAATRATRQTQQNLNQEQLAWLQEDMKEIRQEQAEFQQELREEDLLVIRNEVEQLRQEIDSNDCLTKPSDFNSLLPICSSKDLIKEVSRINWKLDQVEGLKMELQMLERRVAHMEERRHESVKFSRTLTLAPPTRSNPSRPQQYITSMPVIGQQQTQMIFATIDKATARPMPLTNVVLSPNLPGAFLDPVIDLDEPAWNMPDKAVERPVVQRSRRPASEPEVIEIASPIPILTQKWSYSGPRQWRRVMAAFLAFGLEYPKLKASQSIKILEDHINSLNMQNSELASKYGEVALGEGHIERLEESGLQDSENVNSYSLPKRKHLDVEDTPEPPSKKRKRRSGHSATEQSLMAHQMVMSSTLERTAPINMSSNHGSPELGQDSLLYSDSRHKDVIDNDPERSPDTIIKNLQSPKLRKPIARPRKISNQIARPSPVWETASRTAASEFLTGSAPDPDSLSYNLNRPFECGECRMRFKDLKSLQYHKEHSSCSNDDDVFETEFPCSTCGKLIYSYEGLRYHMLHTPDRRDAQDEETKTIVKSWQEGRRKSMMRTNYLSAEQANPVTNAGISSTEDDECTVPGAFPDETIVQIDPGMQKQQVEADLSKAPFKCGACGKEYKNSGGLKYHKEHSNCDAHPDDVMQTGFCCTLCNKLFKTYSGLNYHLEHGICTTDEKTASKLAVAGREQKRPPMLAAEQEQKTRAILGAQSEQNRKVMLAAREKLVTEALERER